MNGRLLAERRLKRALTREAAAKQMQLTARALARAEAGGPVRLETIRTVADFYGIDPELVIILDEVPDAGSTARR